jgi:hypothetical protein
MIGEDYGWAFERDVFQLSGTHRVFDIQLAEDAVENASFRTGERACIDAIQPTER